MLAACEDNNSISLIILFHKIRLVILFRIEWYLYCHFFRTTFFKFLETTKINQFVNGNQNQSTYVLCSFVLAYVSPSTEIRKYSRELFLYAVYGPRISRFLLSEKIRILVMYIYFPRFDRRDFVDKTWNFPSRSEHGIQYVDFDYMCQLLP